MSRLYLVLIAISFLVGTALAFDWGSIKPKLPTRKTCVVIYEHDPTDAYVDQAQYHRLVSIIRILYDQRSNTHAENIMVAPSEERQLLKGASFHFRPHWPAGLVEKRRGRLHITDAGVKWLETSRSRWRNEILFSLWRNLMSGMMVDKLDGLSIGSIGDSEFSADTVEVERILLSLQREGFVAKVEGRFAFSNSGLCWQQPKYLLTNSGLKRYDQEFFEEQNRMDSTRFF